LAVTDGQVSAAQELPKRLRWALVLVLSIVAIFYIIGLVQQLPTRNVSSAHIDWNTYRDFQTYYSPALLLRRGSNPYKADPLWGDTPTWFLCFEPLTFFPPFTAYWAWFCLNLFFLATSIWILVRDGGLKGSDAWIVGTLMLMYPPVATNFWLAQSEVALLFILVMFIHELDRGREVTSGLILAAASLLRAYPLGLLGYLIARRKWRAAEFTILGCLVGLAITYLVAGPDVVTSYLRNLGLTRGLGLWGSTPPLNQPIGLLRHPANLNAAWFVKFGLVHAFGIGETSAIAAICGFLGEFALAAIVFIQTTRFADSDDRDHRAFSMWIITVSILSPIMWPQFMACFVIVFVSLAGAATRSDLSRRAAYSAVASYLLISVLGKMHGYPFDWAEMLELRLSPIHPHVVHVLAEATTGSLILLFLSAYWFMCDITDTCQAKATSHGTSIATSRIR
jgi:hypothetical protein